MAAVATEGDAASAACGPRGAAVGRVLPACAGLDTCDVDRAGVGDAVTSRTAVAGERQRERGGCRSIQHNMQCGGIRRDVVHRIGLADLHVIGGIGSEREAGAGASRPTSAIVGRVLPGAAGFQAGDIDGAHIGDAVACGSAVGGQSQAGSCRGTRIDDEVERGTDGRGVAGCVGLLDLDVVDTVGSVGDAVAAAGRPGHAVVDRVLPAGAAFDAGHGNRAVGSDAVVRRAVIDESEARRCRRGRVERNAERLRGGHVAGHVGLPGDNAIVSVRTKNDSAPNTGREGAAIQRILPVGAALDTGDVDRVIVGYTVTVADAGIGQKRQAGRGNGLVDHHVERR